MHPLRRACVRPAQGLLRARPGLGPAGARRLCEAGAALTHVRGDGTPAMVDVGGKAATRRTAVAGATVVVGRVVGALLRRNVSPAGKGDVFAVAQLAGIMAAKRTPDLIPLCHSVPLARVAVELALGADGERVHVRATAETGPAQTGVEMEALTAASLAALTVYDMCKAASKDMSITDVRLLAKTGGKSGDYARA
jgi:cyclic pyranopterin monophosphate synthase